MRRPQPRPLVVPEDEPPAYRLTASGVFEQGGIIVSRAGCVIAGGADGGATPLTDDGPPPWLRGGGSDCAGGGSSPSSSRLPSPQPPWWRDGDTDDSSSQLPELAPSTQQQQSPILPPRELQQQQQHTPQRTAAAIALEDLQDLGVVGSGSGGVVRGVRHVPSGERLVLKSIRLDLGSEAALGRVVSEVRSLAAAAHPHVVSYRQAFLVDGALTILMEWMDGGSLADVLGRVRAVPGRLLPELARQATEGLAHLHGGPRICHRDLKPSNLLLSSAGVLKIADFGVASTLSVGASARCASWVGTVTYMAPERIGGGAYGFAADVWALGLLLLEAATGRYPYAAAGGGGPGRLGFWDLLECVVAQPAPRLPPGDHYPPGLSDFLEACLRKDPRARPSAAQLLQHPFIAAAPRADLAELLTLRPEATQSAAGINSSSSSSSQVRGGQGGVGGTTPGAVRPRSAAAAAAAAPLPRQVHLQAGRGPTAAAAAAAARAAGAGAGAGAGARLTAPAGGAAGGVLLRPRIIKTAAGQLAAAAAAAAAVPAAAATVPAATAAVPTAAAAGELAGKLHASPARAPAVSGQQQQQQHRSPLQQQAPLASAQQRSRLEQPLSAHESPLTAALRAQPRRSDVM